MWRSFFIALGISIAILGCEGLLIDKAVVRWPSAEPPPASFFQGLPSTGSAPAASSTRVIQPTDPRCWFLITAGVLVVVYTVAVTKT